MFLFQWKIGGNGGTWHGLVLYTKKVATKWSWNIIYMEQNHIILHSEFSQGCVQIYVDIPDTVHSWGRWDSCRSLPLLSSSWRILSTTGTDHPAHIIITDFRKPCGGSGIVYFGSIPLNFSMVTVKASFKTTYIIINDFEHKLYLIKMPNFCILAQKSISICNIKSGSRKD